MGVRFIWGTVLQPRRVRICYGSITLRALLSAWHLARVGVSSNAMRAWWAAALSGLGLSRRGLVETEGCGTAYAWGGVEGGRGLRF